MSLATAVTGLLLCVLGFTHAARAIRFLPYPVIGGFLGATGWLMVTGAIQVVTDQRPTFANLGAFADTAIAAKARGGRRRRDRAACAAAPIQKPVRAARRAAGGVRRRRILSCLLSGTTPRRAQASGWMFNPQPAAGLTLPWKHTALTAFPWASLPSLAGDALAVMFVTISTLLLNTTGIEIATRTEANIERDLKVLGIANLLTAAFGGYVSCTSLSRSILVRTAGATSRLSGLTVAAISAAVLIADPSFLGYVPKYVLAGLLFYLGSDLVYQWLMHSSRRLLPLEYLSLIAIAALIIYSGFIAGVLIGIVIGCATFAFSASRVNAIKFTFDGSEFRSSLDRGPRELYLAGRTWPPDPGHSAAKLSVFRLGQPALSIRQDVAGAAAGLPVRHFRFPAGHWHRFLRHAQLRADQAGHGGAQGARIVLVNLSPELERAFRTARFIYR